MAQRPPASRPPASPPPPISLEPEEGWHCSHFFYSFDRGTLKAYSSEQLQQAMQQWSGILTPEAESAPERLQVSAVSGHKADFGLMMMDPNPLKIQAVHHALMSSELGPALRCNYSFVSVTEVSEYVPSLEQYGQRLIAEGETEGSPAYEAKLKAYAQREPMMRKQRLTPDLPPWPATCFYPMNKKRKVGENWFTLPFDERNKMMAEHARSGMSFAGKVTQLITVSVGLDDWEWGVTLWGRNPQYLKDIVYTMRFDEASARYAEFGPFYTSYVCSVEEMLDQCRLG